MYRLFVGDGSPVQRDQRAHTGLQLYRYAREMDYLHSQYMHAY